MEQLDPSGIVAYLLQPDVSPLIIAVSFFGGLLLGNRLTIGRDRRRERNAAAQIVRETLLREQWPSVTDLDLLERLLPFHKRRDFRKAIERYEKSTRAATHCDSVGGVFYSDAGEMKADHEALLSYTRWH